jgi:hypothetical protein
LRGGSSGVWHLEFCSGFLLSRLCAASKPSGEKPLSKFVQPPAKHPKKITQKCSCKKKKKNKKQKFKNFVKVGDCEGWGRIWLKNTGKWGFLATMWQGCGEVVACGGV